MPTCIFQRLCGKSFSALANNILETDLLAIIDLICSLVLCVIGLCRRAKSY